MASDSPIRIMAVDDHPLFRQGIATIVSVEAGLKLVAEAANGREAIQQHPTLVKTLGVSALTVIMSHLSQRH